VGEERKGLSTVERGKWEGGGRGKEKGERKGGKRCDLIPFICLLPKVDGREKEGRGEDLHLSLSLCTRSTLGEGERGRDVSPLLFTI